MPSDVSLLQMPDDVMRRILDKCGFLAILILRKTCHSLRNFIDDVTPSYNISTISIRVDPITLSLELENDDDVVSINYWKTTIKIHKNAKLSKVLENVDSEKIFFQELENILANVQKSGLKWFKLLFIRPWGPNFLEKFQKILSETPIKVKFARLKIPGDVEISSNFSNFQSDFLEKLWIINSGEDEGKVLDLEKMHNLSEWRNLKEIDISGFLIKKIDFNIFENCESVKIGMRFVGADDVMRIKEIFFRSVNLKFFKLRFSYLGDSYQHEEIFQNPENRKISFQIPDQQKVLFINFDYDYFVFEKKNL